MMPTFDGRAIFGWDVRIATALPPRARQRIGFLQVEGTESIDHGSRAVQTVVLGKLIGANESELAIAKKWFWYYWNPWAYTLIDTMGDVYLNVQLETFTPEPQVGRDIWDGSVFCNYQATFLHLGPYF